VNSSRTLQQVGRLVTIAAILCTSAFANAGTLCVLNGCSDVPVPPVASGPGEVGTIVFIPPTISLPPDPILIDGPPIVIGSPILPGLIQLVPYQTSAGWNYVFSPGSTSIAMPYFSDAQITAVMTPADWTFEVGTTDLFGLGVNAGFMRWTYVGQPGSGSFGMLGFTSNWRPGLSTYRLTMSDQSSYDNFGDIPLSPLAIGAGISADVGAVPEPTMNAMMIIGVAVVSVVVRRRTRQDGLGCQDA
jgi:hypothetical protein